MYYLKYRPVTIEEIDNSRVKELLKKILQSKELPHALLFVGEKGTGKTSAARIFAKSVNCLHNTFSRSSELIEPCNACENCLSIMNNSFTDVLELDAASNRGIEEVKNLIRETAFLPMGGRYRVFIIDEAHMITPDGFNALLKTLEEPPETAMFILATTNPEKIPPTVASRCVKINFGRAKQEDIVIMLHRILEREQIPYDENILKLIAQHADHSFRDAAKILEEFTVQHISTYQQAEKLLGLRGKTDLLETIEKKDAHASLTWLSEFTESAGDHKLLIEDMLDRLRLYLLAKKGVYEESDLNTPLSVSDISLLIKLLLEAYAQLRSTPIESLPLEIALVEFYNKRN